MFRVVVKEEGGGEISGEIGLRQAVRRGQKKRSSLARTTAVLKSVQRNRIQRRKTNRSATQSKTLRTKSATSFSCLVSRLTEQFYGGICKIRRPGTLSRLFVPKLLAAWHTRATRGDLGVFWHRFVKTHRILACSTISKK